METVLSFLALMPMVAGFVPADGTTNSSSLLPQGNSTFLNDGKITNSSAITIEDDANMTITCCLPLLLAPIAASGNNVYVVWWDNKTENWEIFFARSTDNGRTFEQPLNLSNNTGRSENAQVVALDENVYVTWWDNTTGTREVFFRASEDNGKTFGHAIILESTRSMDFTSN
ncbi:sialidase family protein [Candidatus Nitrososphaera gargensis]|uniref:sialidase family protein n=1 Tax=Candidatus Nitrososphaera gargensis TaxID=497727 RepID=UPI0011E4F605|nr:sialidase family protein [Candidatus Nitrososphaera gargensis]